MKENGLRSRPQDKKTFRSLQTYNSLTSRTSQMSSKYSDMRSLCSAMNMFIGFMESSLKKTPLERFCNTLATRIRLRLAFLDGLFFTMLHASGATMIGLK